MKETALLFGDRKSLVGVVTEPSCRPDPERPAVLFLNAGVLHRVGPNRLHVRLARELATEGFVSMRFDFSGLGDSRPRADATSFAEAAVAETRQAMDVLAASHGARSFLLGGMCSGADNALRAAGHDPRVAGAVLIEPHSVPGPGFLLYSYRRKLLNPASWWRLLRGKSEVVQLLKASAADEPVPPAAAPAAIVPSRAELARQVRTLVERRLEKRAGIHVVPFVDEKPLDPARDSNADRDVFLGGDQIARPRKDGTGNGLAPALRAGHARLHVLTRTDHVFTPLSAQAQVAAAIRAWARAAAGAPPANGRGGAQT